MASDTSFSIHGRYSQIVLSKSTNKQKWANLKKYFKIVMIKMTWKVGSKQCSMEFAWLWPQSPHSSNTLFFLKSKDLGLRSLLFSLSWYSLVLDNLFGKRLSVLRRSDSLARGLARKRKNNEPIKKSSQTPHNFRSLMAKSNLYLIQKFILSFPVAWDTLWIY